MGKPYQGYDKTPPSNIVVVDIFQGQAMHESRFAIVDADTGEVFDDAQGYGYRSEEKALSAFKYGAYRREQRLRSAYG